MAVDGSASRLGARTLYIREVTISDCLQCVSYQGRHSNMIFGSGVSRQEWKEIFSISILVRYSETNIRSGLEINEWLCILVTTSDIRLTWIVIFETKNIANWLTCIELYKKGKRKTNWQKMTKEQMFRAWGLRRYCSDRVPSWVSGSLPQAPLDLIRSLVFLEGRFGEGAACTDASGICFQWFHA